VIDLTALFDPVSVAIVGASDDRSKWGYAVAQQALRGADRRPVHLINRRGGMVLGRAAATSLAVQRERFGAPIASYQHAKASMAKLSASEAAGRVIDRCVQIFGGRGYDRSYPVERMYREIRVDRIWEGTSEIQRLIIANELIKRGTGVLNLPGA
jgi:alkylation response protein AidB-like acyl-CoA dehydrogenase